MATTALTPGPARTTLARPTASSLRPVGGHFGARRAVVMLPAIVGGVLLMLALTAGLRAWGTPIFLLWLAGAAVVSTRWGERLAVRMAYGFRPLSGREHRLLEPVFTAALARCDRPCGDLDCTSSQAASQTPARPASAASRSPTGR